MYTSIEQALKTNHPALIIEEKSFKYNGNDRVKIRARKANGKKDYLVIKYENGNYSSAVTL